MSLVLGYSLIGGAEGPSFLLALTNWDFLVFLRAPFFQKNPFVLAESRLILSDISKLDAVSVEQEGDRLESRDSRFIGTLRPSCKGAAQRNAEGLM